MRRSFLEITDPGAFRPAWTGVPGARVDLVEDAPPSFYRYLYGEVGRDYLWRDRSGWSDDKIRAYLADPAVSLWVLFVGNAPAGFAELRREPGDTVEIAILGLLPEFIGRGLGGHLLSVAVERAWESGAGRIWLHTCTHDHAAALPNYLRRGFTVFRTESP